MKTIVIPEIRDDRAEHLRCLALEEGKSLEQFCREILERAAVLREVRDREDQFGILVRNSMEILERCSVTAAAQRQELAGKLDTLLELAGKACEKGGIE